MTLNSIAFVDDHPIFLDGLAALFCGRSDYHVVAKGRCAADAVLISSQMHPDILVMDLDMVGNPFEAIKKIREMSPGTKVIAFTASAVVDHALYAFEAGACGYVLKGCTADELHEALRKVMDGETFITPSFAAKVIASLRNAATREVRPAETQLSLREGQIVKLLLRGYTNKEIARDLKISDKTVKHYMTLLMQKLNARNRLGVVIAAQKLSAEANNSGSIGSKRDMLN